jgi:ATP-binding cassette subfamily B protein
MTKLSKYLKPFAFSLLISIILLFGQAMCDLNLPNFMSKIVNVGIQQGGIETAVPEALSVKGFNFIENFMTDGQKKEVNNSFKRISSSDSGREYDGYLKKYPLLKSEDIYVKSTNDDSELNKIFGEASMTFINTIDELGKKQGKSLSTSQKSSKGMDITKLYSLTPIIENLPPEAVKQAHDKAAQNPDSMLMQSGISLCRGFYKEIGMDTDKIQFNYIFKIGAFMLLIALIGGAATISVSYLGSKIASGAARNLRSDIFKKVESFSNHEFDKFSTASLITRTTNDVTQIQMMMVFAIRMICYAPIMGIGGIIMALKKSVSMSWVIALACILIIGLISVIFSIAVPRFKIVQKLIDKLNLVSRENLNGLMVIRAFGTQKFEAERFNKSNKDLADNTLYVSRIIILMFPLMMLIMNLIQVLVVWVGADKIAVSALQVGDMMAFLQYAMQVIMSFLMISIMFIMIPRAAVSGDRIYEVLSIEPSIKDPKNPKEFKKDKFGYVEFKNVSFHYSGAGENALEHITFTAKPGETTAFIGSTGSGKSTLVQLIPRFYDVTSGEVLINGVNVKDITQHKLREQIGYVPQKGILFSGTIKSNLTYGSEDADEETIKSSAEIAQASDFISKLPGEYNSEIAQAGVNVSGGQKQRLSIARALVKNPPIYIFDDSFSALDFATDAALRHELKKHTSESTILIVAQRVGTIMDADQIIVLNEGKIVGIGTHKELLKSCPTYYEIASSQLSKEELA